MADSSQNEIEELDKLDLNLFPMYGDIKILPCSPDKMVSTNLQLESTIKNQNEKINSVDLKNEIKLILDQLAENFPDLTDGIKNMENSFNTLNKHEIICDCTEILTKCYEHIRIINQVCSLL